MGSSLIVPRVGLIISISPEDVIKAGGSHQVRLSYMKEIDTWVPVAKGAPGFIVWLNSYDATHNALRITAITRKGTAACGESLFIDQST